MLHEVEREVGAYTSLAISLVGVTLNCLVVAVIGTETSLRQQPSTIIILCLATTDILYCGVILPLNTATLLDCRWVLGPRTNKRTSR